MIKLKTSYTPEKEDFQIDYHSKILLVGSCFAENIGNKLKESFFKCRMNPFGIMYNPISIETSIKRVCTGEPFQENNLFYANERWNSFKHHSKYSGISPTKTLAAINQSLAEAHEWIKQSNFLFISFGTAWVFRHKESNEIVGNCHKLASNLFVRERLSIEEVVRSQTALIAKIRELNPTIKVIYTLSPVRYLKDGMHENQLSKSILLLAIEHLKTLKDIYYFPAYEIQMDDLRDYRFYAEDLTHPNDLAVKYIWEKFQQSYMKEETCILSEKLLQLHKAMQHRVFNKDSVSHQKFKKSNLKKIAQIESNHPEIDLKIAKEYFSQ